MDNFNSCQKGLKSRSIYYNIHNIQSFVKAARSCVSSITLEVRKVAYKHKNTKTCLYFYAYHHIVYM